MGRSVSEPICSLVINDEVADPLTTRGRPPHSSRKFAKRIVDKNILKLIKMWLTAPVVEEEDGTKRYKGNDKGTPQGGVKTEIKRLTREAYLIVPLPQLIKNLNSVARGWENYFRYRNCSRQLWNVKYYLEGRVRRHLMRKRGKSGWGYMIYTSDYLYKLGLYKMTTSVPWKTTAKASG
jgi:hypothetical protein